MFAAMAGIYVHIPFCRKACHYCNFHFSTSFEKKDELMAALVEEIKIQSNYLDGQTLKTIYFGGGTPSALPVDDIEKVLETISQYHRLASDIEITLEANPDDISLENLYAWKHMGINRLSIGVQALQDELLAGWNRNHSAQQAIESIHLAQSAGFQNITVDLIYGGQGLTDEDWLLNIQALIDAGIPHISSYALTVEKGTALSHQITEGRVKAPDDEQSNRQYSLLQKTLKEAGYEQYEVSNFAQPGFRSRHNTGYWTGAHYLGIGPSAHSYNGISRQWNISNNLKYTHALRYGKVPFEKEILTDVQRYNELVMTGLRTSSGISSGRMKMLDDGFEEYLKEEVKPFLEQNKIFVGEDGNLTLSPEYYFFADGIAMQLFYAKK